MRTPGPGFSPKASKICSIRHHDEPLMQWEQCVLFSVVKQLGAWMWQVFFKSSIYIYIYCFDIIIAYISFRHAAKKAHAKTKYVHDSNLFSFAESLRRLHLERRRGGVEQKVIIPYPIWGRYSSMQRSGGNRKEAMNSEERKTFLIPNQSSLWFATCF